MAQISTAFIHLLAPGLEALENPCLGEAWGNYVRFPSFRSAVFSRWRATALCTGPMPFEHLRHLYYRAYRISMGECEAGRSWKRAWCVSSGDHEFTLIETSIPDAHGHAFGSHAAHGPEGEFPQDRPVKPIDTTSDEESNTDRTLHRHTFTDSVTTQVIGVAILEFGVVLHR